MAQRASRVFPRLRDARVIRAWAALRVMSPDGFPVYARSRAHPGAWVAACHSGVTLAAIHAQALAAAIRDDLVPATLHPFAPERFDVRAAV
jgi:glycine/D-amino acid oxidase-like deaminating enzyme